MQILTPQNQTGQCSEMLPPPVVPTQTPGFFGDFNKGDLCLALALGLASMLVSQWLMRAGYVRSWYTPFLTIFLNWLLVVIAVGDQIKRNHRSKEPAKQLSWHVFLSNIFENNAWVLLSWAVGDPVIVIARWVGLLFDQIVLWQMILSIPRIEKMGKVYMWLKYTFWLIVGVAVGLGTLGVLIVVPLYFLPQMREPQVVSWTKWTTGAIWFWVAIGWCAQIYKNWKIGEETAKNFSSKIPILVQFYLASWILHEFINGKTGLTMYAINGAALSINTILMVQCWHYSRLWQAHEALRRQAEAA